MSLLAGCVSAPRPAHQKVDQTAPDFQKAVAAETARLEAGGMPARQAEKAATGNVTRKRVAAEADRRRALVAPLVRALQAMDAPAGCWAFTETTTTHKDNATIVEIARCDPSQPDEKLWTLVSTDGKAPDDEDQTHFRKRNLALEKNADAGKGGDGSFILDLGHEEKPADDAGGKAGVKNSYDWVVQDALNDRFEVQADDPTTTTFVFDQGRVSATLLVSMDPVRQTYDLDNTTGTVRRETASMGALSALAGTMKADHLEIGIDFAVLDPTAPRL